MANLSRAALDLSDNKERCDDEDEDEDCDDSLGDTNSNTTVIEQTSKSDSDQQEISRKETLAVLNLRILVILVLLMTATAVSLVVFKVTHGGQKNEFESTYKASADKVLEAFGSITSDLSAVAGLSTAATTDGLSDEAEWPFVTMPRFHERAANVRFTSGAMLLSMAPLVHHDLVEVWDEYVQGEDSAWIDESTSLQGPTFQGEENMAKSVVDASRKVDLLHYFDDQGAAIRENLWSETYLPTWQMSPVLKTGEINENLFRRETVSGKKAAISAGYGAFGEYFALTPGGIRSDMKDTAQIAAIRSFQEGREYNHSGSPISNLYLPIFSNFNETNRRPVALLMATLHMRGYFRDVLPDNIQGIDVVLTNSCSGPFTFRLNGKTAKTVGQGDLHEAKFEDKKWRKSAALGTATLNDGTAGGISLHSDSCHFSVDVYPSQIFYDSHITSTPILITCSIAGVFLFAIGMFLFYDRLVENRQALVLQKATQSTAIVSSLFPKNVRDRLIEDAAFAVGNKQKIKGFLNGDIAHNESKAVPIADLFPHCTVFFGDISDFTAWSSTRDPSQVFILLQTIYQAFDELAKRRNVFKVETIGDSYMAATGLPEPQINHAERMVRFAFDCLNKVNEITKELEASLGPDTAALNMRFGLHSGPVTAGVLRGDRARFQLFGDTVNTAARMESHGIKGKIHISQATANCLVASGKSHWIVPRKDSIKAKGKGSLITFWCMPKSHQGSSSKSGTSNSSRASRGSSASDIIEHQEVNKRLVNWVSDLLLDNIKKVVCSHPTSGNGKKENSGDLFYQPSEGKTCFDEVQSVIEMPKFEGKNNVISNKDYMNVVVDEATVESLRSYVTAIASLYRKNPFHSFEHACHVTLSVSKLLGRIVTPDVVMTGAKNAEDVASLVHEQTYGIASDPLATTAILFSALIHDVDHRGCSNPQLMEEDPVLAAKFSNKSIAEQHSVTLAWDIFMADEYKNLREVMFATKADLMRFRQLLVNIVLATDIFDRELGALRKGRWESAFAGKTNSDDHNSTGSPNGDSETHKSDMRATIVLEHVIQASDVSHTMQHWHVYQKWNKNLFFEMRRAFHAGRMAKDPADFWYNGELGFFDNYIIPLAKKLKECGVFGVSADEYLDYAMQNRAEWEERGKEIIKSFEADFDGQHEN